MNTEAETLSASKAMAISQFTFIMSQLGHSECHCGPMKVSYKKPNDNPQVRFVTIEMVVNQIAARGFIVLSQKDHRWQLHFDESKIYYDGWRNDFSYDQEKKTYHITRYYCGCMIEQIDIRLDNTRCSVY